MVGRPSTLKNRQPDRGLLRSSCRRPSGRDVPFVLQDYPYASGVYMAPSVNQAHRADNPSCKMVKHEEWPGLEKLTVLKNMIADTSMRKVALLCGRTARSSCRMSWSAAPTAPTPAMPYPEIWCNSSSSSSWRSHRRRTTCSTGTCRCCAMTAARNARARGAANIFSSGARDCERCTAAARIKLSKEANHRDRVPDRAAGAE